MPTPKNLNKRIEGELARLMSALGRVEAFVDSLGLDVADSVPPSMLRNAEGLTEASRDVVKHVAVITALKGLKP